MLQRRLKQRGLLLEEVAPARPYFQPPLPRATTPVAPAVPKSVSRKTTPRPVPATPKAPTPYAGAVEDDVDDEAGGLVS